MTDGELIRGFRQGDGRSFEILYERYRKPLYSYLNHLLRGRGQVADDIYQQAWMRILDRLHTYREQQRFLAWAFRIAHNLAMDHFRRSQRRQALESEVCEPREFKARPDAEAENRELREALAAALARLPVEQREVFLLRQQEIAFKDIARIQRTGINTALGRMRYAINNLRQLLAEYGYGQSAGVAEGEMK